MKRHFLDIESLSREQFLDLLATSESFLEISERDIKKVPALRGKTIVSLFLEPSTRTRVSFEIAGKRLSADVINVSGTSSSIVKGETLLDTARTIEAMHPDILVIRHSASGAPHFLAQNLSRTSVVNAGDGMHEHPTQALLDCLTLQQHFKKHKRPIHGLRVAIIGDVRHSRVARSNVWAHLLLGNEVRLVGPPTLLPAELTAARCFGAKVALFNKLSAGVEGADVVMCLRMQLERQKGNFVPSLDEYSREYCIGEKLLSRFAPDCVVLHPGPANRGVEISGDVMDGTRSLVTDQVNSGVAARMAVLFSCLGDHEPATEVV